MPGGSGLDNIALTWTGTGTTTPSYLLTDERGSVIGQSNASGVITVNAYDEYGLGAPGNTGTFGYTGQMTLPGTSGLLNYRMRTYDPRIGRFLQMDPIGYQGGMNLFAYVGGDPMNFIDPWGLDRSGTGAPPRPLPGCTITHLDVPEDQIEWEETCSSVYGNSLPGFMTMSFFTEARSGGGFATAAGAGQEYLWSRDPTQPSCQIVQSGDSSAVVASREVSRVRARIVNTQNEYGWEETERVRSQRGRSGNGWRGTFGRIRSFGSRRAAPQIQGTMPIRYYSDGYADINIDLHSLPILGSPSVYTELGPYGVWNVRVGSVHIFGSRPDELDNASVEICVMP